jgi:hypothetical protein
MNSTKSWKMDEVAQVSTGITTEDNYKIPVEIYELHGGTKYYSIDLSVSGSITLPPRQVYASKSQSQLYASNCEYC